MGEIVLTHGPSGQAFRLLDGRRAAARLVGLMGRRHLPPDGGAYLSPCAAIHMLGMHLAIDVVWLDAGDRTLRIDRSVAPGAHFRHCPGAKSAVEIAAGSADQGGFQTGDQWILEDAGESQIGQTSTDALRGGPTWPSR